MWCSSQFGWFPCETVTLAISSHLSARNPTSFFGLACQDKYTRAGWINTRSLQPNPVKLQSRILSEPGQLSVEHFFSLQRNFETSNFIYIWTCRASCYCCHPLSEAFPLYRRRDIRYSKYAAVYWQGGATFSAGAERCSALTITWLKVTENNNDWDEAEPITFSGEPAKTAVPIPFTKELSSRQMMRVSGFHFHFFPGAALQTCFCIWKPTYYHLWAPAEIFSSVEAMALKACSTLGEWSILSRRAIHVKCSVKSTFGATWQPRNQGSFVGSPCCGPVTWWTLFSKTCNWPISSFCVTSTWARFWPHSYF